MVDDAAAALGRIDVAISNAGVGLFGPAEEATAEQIDRQIHTNLTGPIHLAQALLPHLREQGGGRIVQISSVGGQATAPGMAVYHASKWGVEGFFESLAAEVKTFGIGVTIVEPGSVGTDFAGRSKEVTAALPAYKGNPATPRTPRGRGRFPAVPRRRTEDGPRHPRLRRLPGRPAAAHAGQRRVPADPGLADGTPGGPGGPEGPGGVHRHEEVTTP